MLPVTRLLRSLHSTATTQGQCDRTAVSNGSANCPASGVEKAISSARAILSESDQDDTTNALRTRIEELGNDLFQSIGAQLDVRNYQALNPERGAILEFLDTPLNNKLWMEDELDAILTGRFTATMPEKVQHGTYASQGLHASLIGKTPVPAVSTTIWAALGNNRIW